MLTNAKKLESYELRARDGIIGQVKDFYFDDQQWVVRYVVVDTGRWLPGRKVLLTPTALHVPAGESHVFAVDLTKDQIRNSPGVETEEPVSRQQEMELHQYFGWPYYWGTPAAAGGMGAPVLAAAPAPTSFGDTREQTSGEARSGGEADGDPNLRSVDHVCGYHIAATDGEIGHVEDFLIDERTWDVRYLVVDTRNWWPGKKVVVSPQWIREVSWPERKVFADLSCGAIKGSPEFDPARPLTEDYSGQLHDYYGRPRYDRW